MKSMLANLPVFVLAFILVTGAMIYMNGAYKNIWKGDFTPVGVKKVVMVPKVTTVKKKYLKEFLLQKLKPELQEHIREAVPKKIVDTVYSNIVIDTALLDSFKVLNDRMAVLKEEVIQALDKAKKTSKKKKKEVVPVKNVVEDKTKYKTTAKLLESMTPAKAAKVISYYSDNKAREIILLMNKKKAAKLMEIMDPAKIARIMGKS